MNEPPPRPSLALLAANPLDAGFALELGARLGLPVLQASCDPADCEGLDAVLVIDAGCLALQRTGKGAPGPVSVDFGSGRMRHRRRSGHNELLGRAVGVGRKPRLRVLDATAGLGRDSLVLADLGCEVFLCEREPVIVEMLRAGMRSATGIGDQWLEGVLARMWLLPGDARELAEPPPGLDVIYLDPMFPRRGKSAAVKKEMALFQLLLEGGADPGDEQELLLWALSTAVPRVVVKRPASAPHLCGRRPSHCISGKAVRFDVYQRPEAD